MRSLRLQHQILENQCSYHRKQSTRGSQPLLPNLRQLAGREASCIPSTLAIWLKPQTTSLLAREYLHTQTVQSVCTRELLLGHCDVYAWPGLIITSHTWSKPGFVQVVCSRRKRRVPGHHSLGARTARCTETWCVSERNESLANPHSIGSWPQLLHMQKEWRLCIPNTLPARLSGCSWDHTVTIRVLEWRQRGGFQRIIRQTPRRAM